MIESRNKMRFRKAIIILVASLVLISILAFVMKINNKPIIKEEVVKPKIETNLEEEREVIINSVKPIEFRNGHGQIEMEGQTVNFRMEIPIKGGEVSGSISGFCNGSLKGVFDPRTNYTHGNMDGKCIGIPAKGTFKGEIDLENSIGSGEFEGKTLLITKSGSWKMIID